MGQSKTYELNYGNKATINTGNYENESPMFNVKKIITLDDGLEIDIASEFKEMRFLVDNQLHKAIDETKNRGKAKALEGFRIKEIEGVQYPSVTTIITPEMPEIPNLELYGLRGNMWDRVFTRMVEEGKYEEDFTKEELDQLVIIGGMKGHSLEWVVKNEDFDFRTAQVNIVNKKDIYCGRYDADGFYKGDVATFDCKSGTLNKSMIDKSFMQLAAYAKAREEQSRYLVIIPTQKQEPIVSEEVDKYYAKFMKLRAEFKDKYGI